jgi:hypothetical protein
VYNFFVEDERINDSGSPRDQGDALRAGSSIDPIYGDTAAAREFVNDRSSQVSLPRYIEITFTPAMIGHQSGRVGGRTQLAASNGNLQKPSEFLLPMNTRTLESEEDSGSKCDVIMRFQDRKIKTRLAKKAEIMASLLGVGVTGSVTQKVAAITAATDYIDGSLLQAALYEEGAAKFVNEIGDTSEEPYFEWASNLALRALIDRRLLLQAFGGNLAEIDLNKEELFHLAVEDAVRFLANYQPSNDIDVRLFDNLQAAAFSASASQQLGLAATAGYIITRTERRADGAQGRTKIAYLKGRNNTRFIDTEVLYGSTYTYAVRTIAVATIFYGAASVSDQTRNKGWTLQASESAVPAVVEAIDNVPPEAPDGVFYKFNYAQGKGLYVTWQIPVGNQRDVRYFQVFRRRTIHEPFTCIAELDFDNSTVKSSRREFVSTDRVIKLSNAPSAYKDTEYDRSSSYIYAVVAVDAHGLSSGYSAQNWVTFDKTTNQIKIKNISRSGAPKQYPNIFIDPELDDNVFVDSLTQDAILSSKKKSARIYFDPDTVLCTTTINGSQPMQEHVVRTGTIHNPNALYKLQFINTDRQKAADIELVISDLR